MRTRPAFKSMSRTVPSSPWGGWGCRRRTPPGIRQMLHIQPTCGTRTTRARWRGGRLHAGCERHVPCGWGERGLHPFAPCRSTGRTELLSRRHRSQTGLLAIGGGGAPPAPPPTLAPRRCRREARGQSRSLSRPLLLASKCERCEQRRDIPRSPQLNALQFVG